MTVTRREHSLALSRALREARGTAEAPEAVVARVRRELGLPPPAPVARVTEWPGQQLELETA